MHSLAGCANGWTMRTNVRVQGPVLAELRDVQSLIESRTGVRPSLAGLLERVVRDGAAVARARVLAVDPSRRSGE